MLIQTTYRLVIPFIIMNSIVNTNYLQSLPARFSLMCNYHRHHRRRSLHRRAGQEDQAGDHLPAQEGEAAEDDGVVGVVERRLTYISRFAMTLSPCSLSSSTM